MNRWKKRISILLVAALLVSLLSGCGGTAAKQTDSNTLSLNIAGNDRNRIRLVAAMREKFPDISFDVNFCNNAAGTEFINSTIRNGDSSDIIFIILYVYATIFISVCVYRLDNGFLV